MQSYIENTGMLVDLLSDMVASLPNNFPDFLPDRTMDSMFQDLWFGIEALSKKLGPERHARCLAMANDARAAYDALKVEQGREVLTDMIDVVTGIKSVRLRDLDDVTRARVEAGEIIGDVAWEAALKRAGKA